MHQLLEGWGGGILIIILTLLIMLNFLLILILLLVFNYNNSYEVDPIARQRREKKMKKTSTLAFPCVLSSLEALT